MSSWLRLTASVAKLPSRFRLTLKFSSKPFFQTYKYCQNSSHTSLFRRQYQQHACRTVSHICRTFTVQRQSRLKSIRYASQGSRKAHHTSFLTTSVSRRQLSLQSEQGDLWKNSPFQSKVLNALGVRIAEQYLLSLFMVVCIIYWIKVELKRIIFLQNTCVKMRLMLHHIYVLNSLTTIAFSIVIQTTQTLFPTCIDERTNNNIYSHLYFCILFFML